MQYRIFTTNNFHHMAHYRAIPGQRDAIIVRIESCEADKPCSATNILARIGVAII